MAAVERSINAVFLHGYVQYIERDERSHRINLEGKAQGQKKKRSERFTRPASLSKSHLVQI